MSPPSSSTPAVSLSAAGVRPEALPSWPTRLFLPGVAAASVAVLADCAVNGWAVQVLAAVAVVLGLSRWSLKAAFYCVAFLLPLGQVYTIGMSRTLHSAAPLLEIPLLAFFVAWFVDAVRRRTAFRSFSREDLPWLPFLVFALGAAVVTCAVALSQAEVLPRLSLLRMLFKDGPLTPLYPVRVFFTFVESFTLYAFVRTRLERGDVETLCRVLLGSFLVVVLAGFYAYFRFNTAPRFLGVNRATGMFLGPNEFGTYLLMALPVAAWTVLQARNGKLRLVALVGSVAGLVLLALTRSQGAGLALAVVLPVAGLLAVKSVPVRRLLVWGGLGLVLVGAGWVGWMWLTQPAARLNELSDGRYFLFLSASNMVRTSPFVGVGLGRFHAYLGSFYPEGIAWRTQHEHAHNMYLQVLAELGVIGFALLFWPLGRLLVRSFRGQAPRTALTTVLLVALSAALVHGLTDYTLLIVPIALLFWTQVGMLEVSVR